MVIRPPGKAVQPPRPRGSFGLEITLMIDGVPQPIWLSGHSTARGDIFRTPADVRLGLPVGKLVTQLLQGAGLDDEDNEKLSYVESALVDRLELQRQGAGFVFGLEIAVKYGAAEDSMLRLWVRLGKENNNATFGLKLRLGDPAEPVEVDVEVNDQGFFARLSQTAASPRRFNLASVGQVLSPELADLMGAIEIAPQEMVLGAHRASGSYLFGVQLAGDLALSRLPFIGERLPASANVGISHLSLVWCSPNLKDNAVAHDVFTDAKTFKDSALIHPRKAGEPALDPLLSGGLFSGQLIVPSQPEPVLLQLPLQSSAASPSPSSNLPETTTASKATSKAGAKKSGVNRSKSAKKKKQKTNRTSSSAAQPSTEITPSSDPSAKWFEVGKTVGPLTLQRIGLKYEKQKVWFLFDTSLSAGAVTLIVDGLGAGLDPFALLGGRFEPAFTLRGLGLVLTGPAEVSGAFLREHITDPRGDYDEFSGVVLIKTKAMTISGMGSYADPAWSAPSFFAYAFLDKPIGGPPFFFVTGLALGIAINRNLDLPPIDQVSQFPLVRLALGEELALPPTVSKRASDSDAELLELLSVQQAMKPYTRPNAGQVTLVVGVRFTTFKLMNSFGLLAASFGKPFKLDLLISSRLQVPAPLPDGKSPAPPIAQIGIDLRGTWIPEEGFLIIEGRITEGSWFLDSACRLSGGAAFASWTAGPHKGDFVITVGGYHPKFPVPAHYPRVPRLAFNFIRDPIEIKGDAYFALTPSALMAGGSLSATFSQGKVRAWFNCGADFLVAWEPFSYDARLYVEIGASYRTFLGTARGSVSAKLHLWGPDLTGVATVDLKVFKFDIRFGARDASAPKPISATKFKQRFLPATANELVSIGVNDGLIRSGTFIDGKTPLFVVNPATFSLTVESVIPQPDGKTIGIGPMGKRALKRQDILHYTIEYLSDTSDVTSSFTIAPVEKPVPAALWAPAIRDHEVRSPSFKSGNPTINAIVGHTIQPGENQKPKTKNPKAYTIRLLEANTDTSPQHPTFPTHNSVLSDDIANQDLTKLLAALTEHNEEAFEAITVSPETVS